MSYNLKYTRDEGKYNHPWYKPLPTGRAKVYDLLYKGTTSLLALAAVYGLVEMGRGMYYITAANHGPSSVSSVMDSTASQTTQAASLGEGSRSDKK